MVLRERIGSTATVSGATFQSSIWASPAGSATVTCKGTSPNPHYFTPGRRTCPSWPVRKGNAATVSHKDCHRPGPWSKGLVFRRPHGSRGSQLTREGYPPSVWTFQLWVVTTPCLRPVRSQFPQQKRSSREGGGTRCLSRTTRQLQLVAKLGPAAAPACKSAALSEILVESTEKMQPAMTVYKYLMSFNK